MKEAINSLGLVFDIVGVIILFKYGLPSDVSKEGLQFIAAGKPNQEQQKRYNKYKFWSRFGLGVLVVGFGLQIISNYID